MTDPNSTTRRSMLRAGGVLAGGLALGVSAGTVSAGKGNDNGKQFGVVWANGTPYYTNVVRVLDEPPKNKDFIYFLHDGEGSIVAINGGEFADVQVSPFVSEAAPNDTDWNGGQWVHFSAEVTDLEEFEEDAPFTTSEQVLGADYIEVTQGRPGFGPPNYFICPLTGTVE